MKSLVYKWTWNRNLILYVYTKSQQNMGDQDQIRSEKDGAFSVELRSYNMLRG